MLLTNRIGYDKTGVSFPFQYIMERPGYFRGPVEFAKDIRAHLKWPRDSKGNKISIDTMHISFIIEKDGHFSDITLLGKIDSNVNKAFIDAVQKCRNWAPFRYYGVPFKAKIICALSYKSGYIESATIAQANPLGTTNATDKQAYYSSLIEYREFEPDF